MFSCIWSDGVLLKVLLMRVPTPCITLSFLFSLVCRAQAVFLALVQAADISCGLAIKNQHGEAAKWARFGCSV